MCRRMLCLPACGLCGMCWGTAQTLCGGSQCNEGPGTTPQMDTAGLQVPQRSVHTQGAQPVGSVGASLGHSPCPVGRGRLGHSELFSRGSQRGGLVPSLFPPRCRHLGSLRKGYQLITLCLCLPNVTVVLAGTVRSCSPPLLKALPVLGEAAAMPFCGPFEAELELLTALTGWRGVRQGVGAGWSHRG